MRPIVLEAVERRVMLSAGQLDPFFGTAGIATTALPDGPAQIYAIESLPDGRILAAGGDGEASANDKLVFARYRPDGQPDPTFGDGSLGLGVRASDIDDTGGGVLKLLGKGKFLFLSESRLIRFNSDGSIDPTFTQDEHTRYKFPFRATSIDVQDDGYIVIGGNYRPTQVKNGHFAVARLKPNGTRDRGFGIGGVADFFFPVNGTVTSVRAMSDGSTMAAGGNYYGYPNDITEYTRDDGVCVKLTPVGALDTTYGNNGVATVTFRDFAGGRLNSYAAPDGSAFLCNYDYPDDSSVKIVRISPSGTRDMSYGNRGLAGGGVATSVFMAVQRDGSLLASYGGFTDLDPNPGIDTLRRFTPAGALDASFGTAGVASVAANADNLRFQSVSLALDGSILVPFDAGQGMQIARFWGNDAPALQARAKNRRIGGDESHLIGVSVRDDLAVDVRSLDSSDVRIILPGGGDVRPTLIGIDQRRGPALIGMNLKLPAPGGSWGFEDNGAYQVRVLSNHVFDTDGNAATGRLIGTFWVNIAEPQVAPATAARTMGLPDARDDDARLAEELLG